MLKKEELDELNLVLVNFVLLFSGLETCEPALSGFSIWSRESLNLHLFSSGMSLSSGRSRTFLFGRSGRKQGTSHDQFGLAFFEIVKVFFVS